MKKIFFVITILLFASTSYCVPKKFLFDATKAETAGNADWVIDEDSSPQRFPTPLQSTVTGSTLENYWTGALSSWAIRLVQLGNNVETLPSGTPITYGNTSNVQDLANYDVFVLCEPNSPFTATEKTAIMNFVHNGGGLFLISDHAGADRNNDGWDAIRVLNDLIRNNTVQANGFGVIFDSLDFSETSSNVLTNGGSNLILNGIQGNVAELKFSNGTSLTINPAVNSNAKGVIWKTSAAQNNANIMCATTVYGTGRVCFVGDSSPPDDGTGGAGHTLYNGWTEIGNNHKDLFINASLWIAKLSGVTAVNPLSTPVSFKLNQNYPNPFNPSTTIKFSIPNSEFVTLKIYDGIGREVNTLVNDNLTGGEYTYSFSGNNLSSGVYYYSLIANGSMQTKRMMLVK